MSEQDIQSDPTKHQRLVSLDAYRGLIMISLAFVGFGLANTADNFLVADPNSSFWTGLRYQFSHAQWVGCSYWDLIQPSFMFMVGVSMAFSYAKRKSLGHSYASMLTHAATRACVLVLLSIFLMSTWKSNTNFVFTNVLAQIGLGYAFLFLVWDRTPRVQLVAATLILVGTWCAYEFYPKAGIDIEAGAPEIGVTKQWAAENLEGIRKPWHKNANIGQAIDVHFINTFPRAEKWEFDAGGYHTINFVPSIATMIFGLMCGELLRSTFTSRHKLTVLIAGGIAGLAIGLALDASGLCPIVKRIWSPSWTSFSTGWCCLILASLYGVIDVLNFRRWSFPLVVVGMNSIAIYCMSMTLKPWIARQLNTHFGEKLFTLYGNVNSAIEPSIQATLVGLVLWSVCYFLYRNKAFLRI